MQYNKIMIIATCVLSMFGLLAIAINSQKMLLIYTLLVTTLLGLVTIGGIIDYNRTEKRDLREIYQEKIKLMKEKQQDMTETIIAKEKELIKLRGKICQESNTANRGPCDNTWAAKRIS